MAKKFGRYELVQEIGRGGQAVVYEAHDPELRRSVALKVLLPGTRSLNSAKRFVREARAAARLKHDNIISIFDVGEWQSRHYMAMELVDGGSLDSLIASRRLRPRDAVTLIERVADAVQCAHEQGIVHRDIKPGNILMDTSGRPRLTDFGFALDEETRTRMTQSGTVMGTPAYMPPEQARGHAHAVDARSDVYSLGATLYEMLAGHPPFEAETSLMLLSKIVHESPRSPSELRRAVPHDASTIALKCLEKEPGRRYQTAEELADDCRRFLAGEPISARPASVLYLARKGLARHKALASGALSVISALLVGLIAALYQWRAADAALVEARRERKKALEAKAVAEEAEARAKEALAQTETERQKALKAKARAEDAEKGLKKALAEGERLLREKGATEEQLTKIKDALGVTDIEDAEVKRHARIESKLAEIRREVVAGRWRGAWNLIGDARKFGVQDRRLEELSQRVIAELPVKLLRGPLGLEFVLASGGTFQMGNASDSDEAPVHEVTVSSFYMGRHEVTNAQFEAFRQGRRKALRDKSVRFRRPVVSISWQGAVEFCKYLSSIDPADTAYRLPTETEWEFAARGTDGRTYPWGNELPTRHHANLLGKADGFDHLAPVGSFAKGATPSGIFDLAGNAGEWCADWYGDYSEGPQRDPAGAPTGTARVVRGGAYEFDRTWVRSAARARRRPDDPSNLLGFRVVRGLTDEQKKFERLAKGE